ncbi:MAG TPA: hypothetical protein VLE22_10495 [Bryobacteraceae bacterium]|nr:hypothetical protein [Bryobacteraceae bacterium]
MALEEVVRHTPSCMTRRRFGLTLCGVPLSYALAAEDFGAMPWAGPASVAKVYLAGATIHWPKPDLDVQKDIAEIEARLAEFERKHPNDVRFTGGQLLRKEEDVAPWAQSIADADAVLILPLAQPLGPLGQVLDAIKVPALYFSRPYAGHSWASIAGYRKSGKRVDAVASSSYGDLDAYAGIFRTIHHLRKSRMLVVANSPRGRDAQAKAYSEYFGTDFRFLTYDDLNAAFADGDERKARQAAEEFTRGALRVVEPKPKEIQDALRFYFGIAGMMKREKANAVTVDCFGGLLAHKLPAYPCITWSKLNDQGLYGVCEGDIESTMSQMLVTSYSGMPGFVSDPVIDLSRNEIIHAHCVAATKMKGIGGSSSPYIIRNHLETNEGAVLQVLMPSGETITCGRFATPKKFLVSTAVVTGNVDSDRGCRSQIRTQVTDAQKMLEAYSAGLHRVIFYGDHVKTVERMGRMMGFEVVKEI